ncbi:MAG: DUF3313 domain-containing protein [Planctomycetes bacterium]|nr:DUF3313 domain-containing protein [Planctomycetota bacterium]
MKNIKPSKNLFYLCIIIIGITSLLSLGCVQSTQTVTTSGFLKDYSQLEPWDGDKDVMVYQKPDVNWKQYKRLMIDPIEVAYHPDTKSSKVTSEELVKLKDYFHEKLVKAVDDGYPVTNTPAPDVLRIRVAITDVKPTNTAVNVVSSAAIFVPVSMGGAAIEAEFIDSVTKERLYACAEQRVGVPVNMIEGMGKFSHTKPSFKYWAKELRKWLDEVNEVK